MAGKAKGAPGQVAPCLWSARVGGSSRLDYTARQRPLARPRLIFVGQVDGLAAMPAVPGHVAQLVSAHFGGSAARR